MTSRAGSLTLERTAVFGSTRLTQMLLEYLDGHVPPRLLLGLSAEQRARKVNAVDLSEQCAERGIEHHAGAEWSLIAARLRELEIDTVLVFGDSRIVPAEITRTHTVIGNHGAPLPEVRGGASLVWGRMADLGEWGVSLFELTDEIDGGRIFASTQFRYAPEAPMREFVAQSDAVTLEAFRALIERGASPAANENEPCRLRLEKGVDSYEAVEAMRTALAQGEPIYMPIRTPADALVKPEWPAAFQRAFMIANDSPYPRWSAEPGSAARR